MASIYPDILMLGFYWADFGPHEPQLASLLWLTQFSSPLSLSHECGGGDVRRAAASTSAAAQTSASASTACGGAGRTRARRQAAPGRAAMSGQQSEGPLRTFFFSSSQFLCTLYIQQSARWYSNQQSARCIWDYEYLTVKCVDLEHEYEDFGIRQVGLSLSVITWYLVIGIANIDGHSSYSTSGDEQM